MAGKVKATTSSGSSSSNPAATKQWEGHLRRLRHDMEMEQARMERKFGRGKRRGGK